MPSSRAARLALFLADLVLLAPAAWQIAALVWIFASRITYPMDIEWMEGGALLHAHRFLRGEPVYGPPSQGFIPYPYPPLHFVAIAAVGKVFGLDYWTGRAVSIFFFALACAVMFREAWRAEPRRGDGIKMGVFAVAGAAASFPAVGGWYDIVRNDSMAIALVILGAGVLSDRRLTRGRIFASAALFTAAVFTKQTAVFFIAWCGLWVFFQRWPSALKLALATAAGCVTTLVVLQVATRGLFWTWTVTNLSKHVVRGAQALEGVRILFMFAPYLAAVPLLAGFLAYKRWLTARTALWLGMLVAAIPASLLPFAKAGGYLNNLIPVAFLAGPVFVLLAGDLVRGLGRRSPRRVLTRALVRWGIVIAVAGYLAVQRYDMSRSIPSVEHWAKAKTVNAFIASLEGGVIIPNHPFLAVRNGQPTPQFHEMAYEDAMSARVKDLDLPGFLKRGGAKWAIVSGVESPNVRGWIYQRYQPEKRVPGYLTSITGYRSGPKDLMRLRKPTVKREAHMLFDFEGPGLRGWQTAGNAFEAGAVGEAGRKLVSSYHPKLRDEAIGVATSPVFVIDRTHLGFLIGGGRSKKARVELRVDAKVIHQASGIESDVLTEVVWDVRRFKGREARILLVDEEPKGWGHVVLDQVELFDKGE